MNNPGPFFNPFMGQVNSEQSFDKLNNKINRLEKDIRILENRLNKLEKKEIKPKITEEPTDMYMI